MFTRRFNNQSFKLSKLYPQQKHFMHNESQNEFTFAAIQMEVGSDKNSNIKHAKDLILEASQKGATLISLPVYFFSTSISKFSKRILRIVNLIIIGMFHNSLWNSIFR
jgi:hypothetical protein